MNNVDTLTEIETQLRKKETDRAYLSAQLQLLAAIIEHDGENESGLIQGALGGAYYCLQRLRELWKEEGQSEPPSIEALMERYSMVELSRYAMDEATRDATAEALRKDCMLHHIHEMKLSDGRTVWVFASALDQHTVDGRSIAKGELLEASSTMVASFHAYYRAVREEQEKNRRK